MAQALFWTWESQWLDDDFESCLCELLVSVEEDLSNFTRAMDALSAALGSADEPGAPLETTGRHRTRGLRLPPPCVEFP